MLNENIYIGTELKLNVNIEPISGLSMDDYDWFVEVYCSTKRISKINKQESIRIDENNYIVLVDTEELGAGLLKCKVTAYIPDYDFPDELRTEVTFVDMGVRIAKTL